MTTEECPSPPGGRPPGGPVPRRRLGAELELELALDDDLIVEVGGGDGGVSDAGVSDGDGEEEEEQEEEEEEVEDEVGSVGSDLSSLVVPFPELAPVVFFCLKQTTCPRSWCIRMVNLSTSTQSLLSSQVLSLLPGCL
ncbi:unnamed protein product [Boreogadus saida]